MDCKPGRKLDRNADQFIASGVEGAQRMAALLKGMREYWRASEPRAHHSSVDCVAVLRQALLNLNETGPDATPIVERTMSFLGRRREKLKPVPPPD